jgi:hypothetical protein
MKICSKCEEQKTFSNFGKRKVSKDGYQGICKVCKNGIRRQNRHKYKDQEKVYDRQYRIDNKGRLNEAKREWCKANSDKVKASAKKSYFANRERRLHVAKVYASGHKEDKRDYDRQYRENNQGKRLAWSRRRELSKTSRAPTWLTDNDLQYMADLYTNCREAEEVFGDVGLDIKFHVDHIYPLQGDLVSGLHTPLNLQILSANENIVKSNYYDPDEGLVYGT